MNESLGAKKFSVSRDFWRAPGKQIGRKDHVQGPALVDMWSIWFLACFPKEL